MCLGRRPVTVQRHGRAAQAAGRGGIQGKGSRHYQDKGTLFGAPQCEPDDEVRAATAKDITFSKNDSDDLVLEELKSISYLLLIVDSICP